MNIVVANDKGDLINYINNKNGDRSSDKITNASFYCHGRSPKRFKDLKENELSFAYDCGDDRQEAKFAFLQSDVGKLNSEAFDNTTTYFYSCNSGTDDGNKGSFAQAWSNKTGGRSLGLKNARTLYAFINSTGNWGLYFGGGIALSPSDCWNYVLSKFGKASDSWKEKMDIKKNRKDMHKGYSELGSLQYPWMVSLAGEFVDSGWLDAFDRHWAWYEPEECEG